MDDRDLMMRFCSLGGNCEFGIAQRFYGADPIDLLRWASTPYPQLLRLLAGKFAGIGDADKLSVVGEGSNMMVRQSTYGLSWHAFAPARSTPCQIHLREMKRLPFLARKAADDLAEAERIFVVRPIHNRPITLEESQALLAAMDAFGGRPHLLMVHDGATAPVIEAVHDRILSGRVIQLADPKCVVKSTHPRDWLALCRAAIEAIVTSHSMPLPAG